jgi:ribokinase
MFPDFGANLDVVLNEERIRAITIASVLVISAYTFMRSETQDLALQAVEIAQASGTRIVIDAASSAPIRLWGAQEVREYLSQADVVLANDDEIFALSEGEHESWLHTLPNLVIKHGQGGASWWSHGELHTQLPAHEISVVDTTGAGDALCGGLVARLASLEDWTSLSDVDRLDALESAIRTASICCTQIGAWPQATPS